MRRIFSRGSGKRSHEQGLRLLDENRFSKAEQEFRIAVAQRTDSLGELSSDTLESKQFLADSLHQQAKYSEAEQHYRQTLVGRERALGHEHRDTLNTKHWLARTLHHQAKYSEAEQHYRQALLGRERALGHEHRDTLHTKHELARTLHHQGKDSEAEQCYLETLLGRQKTLGQDHRETLLSQHALAASLYDQDKFSEAEKHFRRTLTGREKTLGQGYKDTLNTKHWLARTLQHQAKYSEAEQHYRQALLGREKELGHNHKDTLATKLCLEQLLSEQDQQHADVKNNALLRTQGHEIKDRDSGTTPAGKTSEPDKLFAGDDRAKSSGLDTMVVGDVPHLDKFFAEGGPARAVYKDSEIFTISRLVARQNLQWSKVPRTYIVLRTINCLHLLDDFIASGFTDYWFPTVATSLPAVLHTSRRSDFVNAQNLIITKSLDLEKGAEGQHCYFVQGDSLPLEKQRILGQGGFGQVDEVLSIVSYEKYARKRVLRRSMLRGRKAEHLEFFITEIETLKRLQHKHIVKFVGSYSDTKYLGLLMRPVAEMDLSTYLTRPDIASRFGELRTFFGCLATALDYLHTQRVRHKDIKPGNILIDHGNVLFTDFGLSYDFADAQVSTTVSMVNGMTPRYCAPEVALCEPRNTSSDIWSLGVVYLEMFIALKGFTPDYMDDYFAQNGTQQPFIRVNREGFNNFVERLKTVGNRGDNRVIDWISDMLHEDGMKRPHTSLLVATIKNSARNEHGGQRFCGICCLHDGENDSSTDFSD